MGVTSTAMDARDPAPGRLALVERFLRTREDVVDEAGMRAWFRSEGIAGRLPAGSFERFVRVRESIRDLASAHNGGPEPSSGRETVNAEIASLGFAPRVTGTGEAVEFVAPRSDPFAGILAAFLSSVSDGSWTRMKACAADDCSYAFYDHTKNRSARWCDVSACGARTRMRQYRRRIRLSQ
ncbi:MAG TPA: CGNR zinc finger domain-containing protein [Actinomycetota bacterium]|nr:CGNR zinc finger domain-containing protein [Actinomycetota bacterium]